MTSSCKICNTPPLKWTNKINKNAYFYCQNCGFISLDPRRIKSEKEERVRYSLHQNSLSNTGYIQLLNNFINDFITPYANPGENILDFGCGPEATLSKLLIQKNFNTYKYDKYFCNSMCWKEERYKIILSMEVFEHLKNPMEVLITLNNLILKNGKIVIKTALHNEDQDEFFKW